MSHRSQHTTVAGLALAVAASLASIPAAGAAAADGPVIDRFTFVETVPDDFIRDICGIETMTTITGSITVKEFPDGSAQEHVNITFVSDDPRLPIEKQADTRFFAPDGSLTVVGKPVQLIGHDGGVVVLDAGRVVIGEDLVVNGPHPYLETRLAEGDLALAKYYCPTA